MKLDVGINGERKRKVFSFSLEELNYRSEHESFDLKNIQFQGRPSPDIPWMPNDMLPVSYLPAFKLLSAELKMVFNQAYAQAICEQFIWFEQVLLCSILKKTLDKKQLPADLRTCLQHFFDEEDKHSELFWRVLEYSNPERYFERKFFYYQANIVQTSFIKMIASYPDNFLVWIWLAIFFEERTIEFSRKYKAVEKTLEPVFSRAHYLHLLDESRHVQIDQYLLEQFYNKASKNKRRVASWMLESVLKAYISPRRVACNIVKHLSTRFPGEKKGLDRLALELPLLRTHREFQSATFGPRALPRTHTLLRNYEEMSDVLHLLT